MIAKKKAKKKVAKKAVKRKPIKYSGFQTVPVADVKLGDFFRKAGGKKVYIRGAYDRAQKKYECQAFDDISNFAYLKGDKLVEVGFDF